MHYYNIGNGINITTWGTGDKSYNKGNRRCIIATLETGDKYYNRGKGDGQLQQGEQGINITSGGTGI